MMKISKLLKVGAFALLAGSLCFVGCKNDDDENDVITKTDSKNYSVNFTNSGTSVTTRGYEATTFMHRGELVRFTFDSSSTDGGVLGFIWDLEKTDSKLESTGAKGRNFLVFGLATNFESGKIQYYASKYYNISDISARNFGAYNNGTVAYSEANVENGVACEYDITKAVTGSSFVDLGNTSANKVVYWADIYPTTTANHVAGTEDKTNTFTGGYTIDIYEGTADSEELGAKKGTVDIGTDVTGYVAAGASGTEVPHRYLAVYANIYNNKSLKGAWYLKSDYYNDDVVEE
ncbi:MAG: hypothetical protein IJT42_01910 [Treponema sp.]|nr:hypothetical protein [Treponema sp.]